MTQERCETCRFFHKAEPQYVYGDCHRMPPQFNFSANFTEEGYGAKRYKVELSRFQNAVWPNVHHDEWCGEYQEQPHD
jgi:hypothetical protein